MNVWSTWPVRVERWPGPFVLVRNTNRDECPLCRGSISAISLPRQTISFCIFSSIYCFPFRVLGFRVYCFPFYFMFCIYIYSKDATLLYIAKKEQLYYKIKVCRAYYMNADSNIQTSSSSKGDSILLLGLVTLHLRIS